MSNPYTEDYFLRGKETGVSNYTDYRWLPELTGKMAYHLNNYFEQWDPGHHFDISVLDFGCARGYMVKALRDRSIQAFGYDISEWAIKNCHPDVAPFVSNKLGLYNGTDVFKYDWIYSKDVLEHLKGDELEMTIPLLLSMAGVGVFVIVPLAHQFNGQYRNQKDELDATHVTRGTLDDWVYMFTKFAKEEFIVSGSHHIPGLKPSSLEVLGSCGFITCKRI